MGKLVFRYFETNVSVLLLLAYNLYSVYLGVSQVESLSTAVGDLADAFWSIRLVHASVCDFALYTLICPFWMWKDAEIRGMESR